MLALAKEVHRDVVPRCSELGWVGEPNGSQLAIYEMDRLPGENYIIARPSLTRDQRINTVHSLARFVEILFSHPLFAPTRRHIVKGSFRNRGKGARQLIRDRSVYPPSAPNAMTGSNPWPTPSLSASCRLSPRSKAALPTLLDECYPVVLTHSDLKEIDILVDPDGGDFTGVIDWPGASIQPFGFALYALDNALGSMTSGGWKWFDNVDDLRNTFCGAFRKHTGLSEPQTSLIKLAGKAGTLICYGTAYNSGFSGLIGVQDPTVKEDFSIPRRAAFLRVIP